MIKVLGRISRSVEHLNSDILKLGENCYSFQLGRVRFSDGRGHIIFPFMLAHLTVNHVRKAMTVELSADIIVSYST